jgi:hypothetical protein
MSTPVNPESPWASGEGFGTPSRSTPAAPADAYPATVELPAQVAASNYANPFSAEQQSAPNPQPGPVSQPASNPYGPPGAGGYQAYANPPVEAEEPAGWSAPQSFSSQPAVPLHYGATQPYPYWQELPEHPSANTVLVLGIVSAVLLLVAFPVTGPFAWWMGNKARREIRQFPGRYREGGTLTAGWVIGIITSILMAIGAAFLFGLILLIVWGMNA